MMNTGREIPLKQIIDWLKRVNWEMKVRYAELKYRRDTLSPGTISSVKENMGALGRLKTEVLKKLIWEGYATVSEFHTVGNKDYYYIVVGTKSGFHVPVTKQTEEIFYLDENINTRN